MYNITVYYTRHFSGNVWWTSAAHWRSLPEKVAARAFAVPLMLARTLQVFKPCSCTASSPVRARPAPAPALNLNVVFQNHCCLTPGLTLAFSST